MFSSVDFNGRPFHFIGIGGIGMSALAYVLAKRGLPVSGSDVRLNHITQRLQAQGVHIFWSQDASNLEFFQSSRPLVRQPLNSAACITPVLPETERSSSVAVAEAIDVDNLPQVICSTAIPPDNAEYATACKLGCPIFHRSDVLAKLLQKYQQSIAIAGTHGKTTTSSLIGYMLLQAGLDPTVVVGGEVNIWGGNARVGESDYLVAEADESDGSLAKLAASIGVVTNIELDHPDHYSNLDEVVEIFQTFADRCQTLIGCIDCPTVREHLQPTISYSLDIDSNAEYRVDCVHYGADGTTARVWEQGAILGQLTLKLLGRHNLSNALAAIAIGRLLKLDFTTIVQAISSFEGARRRFEERGEFNHILFVDDYAHHPSELQATLAAARLQVSSRQGWARKRIVAIFQPHRYSRTQRFLSEFATSFTDADVVVISDIYSAGESNPGNFTGQQVADLLAAYHPNVYYQPSLQSISKLLTTLLTPGDIALFLGAGNLNQLIPEVMAYHQAIAQGSA
jgi:UDP-N-acetylmuramate--alanine ligase